MFEDFKCNHVRVKVSNEGHVKGLECSQLMMGRTILRHITMACLAILPIALMLMKLQDEDLHVPRTYRSLTSFSSQGSLGTLPVSEQLLEPLMRIAH